MTNANEYVANINPNLRELAEKVRSVTKTTLPDASESLKKGIPTYSLDGINVVAIADYSRHINQVLLLGSEADLEVVGRDRKKYAPRKNRNSSRYQKDRIRPTSQAGRKASKAFTNVSWSNEALCTTDLRAPTIVGL